MFTMRISGKHDDVIKWKHFPRHWPFVTGGFPSQRPVTRIFDVFFDLRLEQTVEQTIETPVIWDGDYNVIVMK